MCRTKTQNGALFCSKECEEMHYEYVLISIPSLWIKSTIDKMNCYERYIEIVKFAKRHNMNRDLVIEKITRTYSLRICKDKN
jgi:hypothetical protein